MVNCNKGTTRPGAKGKTLAGPAVDPNNKAGAEVKVEACAKEIKDSYSALANEYNQRSKSIEKSDLEKIISLCTDLDKQLDMNKIEKCKLVNEADRAKSFDVVKNNMAQCTIAGRTLKSNHNIETPYSKAADEQSLALAKSMFEDQTAMLTMSDDLKKMLKKENLNFKTYIVDGKIKKDQTALKLDLENKKIACSFTVEDAEAEANDATKLSINSYESMEKSELLKSSMGSKMIVSIQGIKQTSTLQSLSCLNLNADKLDYMGLLKTFWRQLTLDKKQAQKKIIETKTDAALEEASAEAISQKSNIDPVAAIEEVVKKEKAAQTKSTDEKIVAAEQILKSVTKTPEVKPSAPVEKPVSKEVQPAVVEKKSETPEVEKSVPTPSSESEDQKHDQKETARMIERATRQNQEAAPAPEVTPEVEKSEDVTTTDTFIDHKGRDNSSKEKANTFLTNF